jgi:hypothetical protein
MKNLLISAFTGYDDIDKVRNLAYSFNAVKKEGDEFIVATHGEETVCHEFLNDLGVKIRRMDTGGHLYHQRFWWYEHIINTEGQDATNVLCVDIRDVVFQYNPFDWLKVHRKKAIVACDEGIYHDEEWNAFMLKQAFDIEDYTLPVLICGVIGGNADEVAKVCSRIGKMTDDVPESAKHDGKDVIVVADQAAYSLYLCDKSVQKLGNDKNWCLTMGMVAASMDVGQNLTVKQGQFLNSEGEVYAIVHQYDRHKVLHYDLSNNRFYAQDEYGGRHDDFTFQLSS